VVVVPLVLLLLGGVFWISYLLGTGVRLGPKYGMVLQSPDPAMDFRLPSHQGQEMALSDFRGEIVLVYFGYSICPDVCPTTLAEVHKALDLLGDEADEVNFIMVSVDPERDTPEVLAEYLAHFDSRFIGLVGTPEKTLEIATNYGIHYDRQESDSALGYLVDHTATVTLIDREGHARLVFPYGTKAEELAEDIRYVLSR
jgi:protein SCO1/2